MQTEARAAPLVSAASMPARSAFDACVAVSARNKVAAPKFALPLRAAYVRRKTKANAPFKPFRQFASRSDKPSNNCAVERKTLYWFIAAQTTAFKILLSF